MKERRYFVDRMQLHHETEDGNPDWLRIVASFTGWVTIDEERGAVVGDTPEEYALAQTEEKLRSLQGDEFHSGYYGVVTFRSIREELGSDVMWRTGVRPLLVFAPPLVHYDLFFPKGLEVPL